MVVLQLIESQLMKRASCHPWFVVTDDLSWQVPWSLSLSLRSRPIRCTSRLNAPVISHTQQDFKGTLRVWWWRLNKRFTVETRIKEPSFFHWLNLPVWIGCKNAILRTRFPYTNIRAFPNFSLLGVLNYGVLKD